MLITATQSVHVPDTNQESHPYGRQSHYYCQAYVTNPLLNQSNQSLLIVHNNINQCHSL